MKYTQKSIDKVKNIWKNLEENYKGSEITMELLLKRITLAAKNESELKNMIKYLWENYEFHFQNEHDYYKQYIKMNFHLKVI